MKKLLIGIVVLLLLFQTAFAYTGTSEWAIAELEKAERNKLIPDCLMESDMSKPINRYEFAAISVKLYEALSGKSAVMPSENPFEDTSEPEILKAFALGITTGTSETMFEPDAVLSREQAATMLARTYGIYSDEIIQAKMNNLFADDIDISVWAKTSVYFMTENGIINGVGNNMFAPKNVSEEQKATLDATSTREQALAISVRMYEKFKNNEISNDDKKLTEEDFVAKIPVCSYGEEGNRRFYGTGLEVQFNNVSREDYYSYIKDVDKAFPQPMNNIDSPNVAFSECTDGEYNISVAHGDGNVMTIRIDKK